MGEWTKEPWRNMTGFGIIYGKHDAAILREPMVCRSPDQYSINDNNFARIVACVNAMQGIPDPAAFVAAFDAMVLKLKTISQGTYCHGPGCPYCESDRDHPRTYHAIAAEKLVAQALATKPEAANGTD